MREKRPEKIAEMLRIHSSGFCHSREQQCSYFGDDHCGQHLAEDAAIAIESLLGIDQPAPELAHGAALPEPASAGIRCVKAIETLLAERPAQSGMEDKP